VITKTFDTVVRRSAQLCATVLLASLCAQPALAQHVNAQPPRAQPSPVQKPGGPIAQSALDQITALLQEKDARSSTERKLSSQLMYALHAGQGRVSPPIAKLYANAREAIAPGGADSAKLTINARVTVTLLKQIEALGGTLIYTAPARQTVTANMPLAAIETLAANPNVFRIAAAPKVTTNAGSLTSQGYVSHKARETVNAGHTGAGVKVGVLSDSVDFLAPLIGTGDLPAGTTVLPGQSGDPGTSEGTAMMEIVHDLAPGAQLFFATAFTSPESMADNIRALRAAGCDIIVDDVSWSNEGVFQDTTIAQAVNDVTADGALYFSSAGNNGNITNGNATAWEGDFADSGTTVTVTKTYKLHAFAAGQPFNVMLAPGQVVDLQWSDPFGGSGNDYDLFVLDPSGTTVLGSSTDVQDGTEDPIEEVDGSFPAGSLIVVGKTLDASVRALHVDMFFGDAPLLDATTGATFGHNAAKSTVGTAAVFWNSARGGTRPFVGGASNPTETFSSDGPRKIFFKPDGTEITPGNVLFGTNGGETLVQPAVAAADGVATRTPGFFPFYGTSAAAPHAAAIAALVKSARPDYTNAQILTAMLATTLDIRAPGIDPDSGHGIVMALEAVNYALTH
jgi:hypothetical protein